MQKKDLEFGNVVETRNGKRYIYIEYFKNDLIDLNGKNQVSLDYYEENLIRKYESEIDRDLDIMKVYKDYTCRKLLWERPKEPLLTEEEKEYLKAIIKPFPKSIKRIVKLKQHGRLIISLYDGYISLGILDETQFHFDRLENEEDYTLKELGLED